MEMENNQPITPTKRVVEVLIDEKGNPHEGEVVKNVLTFETLDLPTLDEVVGKTKPDFDDFDVLRGKMGACDELTEFTKVFYYKEKVDPPVKGLPHQAVAQVPQVPCPFRRQGDHQRHHALRCQPDVQQGTVRGSSGRG